MCLLSLGKGTEQGEGWREWRGRLEVARCCLLFCRKLPEKIGDVLTPEQYREVKELGLLVDRDDQV